MNEALPPFLEALKTEIRRYPVHAVTFERGVTDADWEVQCWVDERYENRALAAWNAAEGEQESTSTHGISLQLWQWWMDNAVILLTQDEDMRTFLLTKVVGQRLGGGSALVASARGRDDEAAGA